MPIVSAYFRSLLENKMRVVAASLSAEVRKYQNTISGTSDHYTSLSNVLNDSQGMTSCWCSIVTFGGNALSSYKPSESADVIPKKQNGAAK